jgi:hypothetical protein
LTQQNGATGEVSLQVSYKILVAGDAGSSITGGNATNGTYSKPKIIIIYRPTIAFANVTSTQQISLKGSSTGPASSTLTLTNQPTWNLGLVAYACKSGATISTRGSTTTATREIGTAGGNLYVKLFEGVDGITTFADSTITMSLSGTNLYCESGYTISFN